MLTLLRQGVLISASAVPPLLEIFFLGSSCLLMTASCSLPFLAGLRALAIDGPTLKSRLLSAKLSGCILDFGDLYLLQYSSIKGTVEQESFFVIFLFFLFFLGGGVGRVERQVSIYVRVIRF